MDKKRLTLFIGVVLLIILVVGFLALPIGKRPPVYTEKEKSPTFDKFHASGVVHSYYKDGKNIFTLWADEITHRKRKLGPFTINPVKEIEMVNVRIEINQDKQDNQKDDTPEKWNDIFLPLSEMLKERMSARGLGFISRVVVKKIALTIFRMGQQQFTIAANRVTVGLKSPKVVLHGFSITSRSGEQLTARKAEWRTDRKLFFIPRTYALRDEKGTTSGQRAFFTIDRSGRIKRVEELSPKRKASSMGLGGWQHQVRNRRALS